MYRYQLKYSSIIQLNRALLIMSLFTLARDLLLCFSRSFQLPRKLPSDRPAREFLL